MNDPAELNVLPSSTVRSAPASTNGASPVRLTSSMVTALFVAPKPSGPLGHDEGLREPGVDPRVLGQDGRPIDYLGRATNRPAEIRIRRVSDGEIAADDAGCLGGGGRRGGRHGHQPFGRIRHGRI